MSAALTPEQQQFLKSAKAVQEAAFVTHFTSNGTAPGVIATKLAAYRAQCEKRASKRQAFIDFLLSDTAPATA